jgi:hypothetical protein
VGIALFETQGEGGRDDRHRPTQRFPLPVIRRHCGERPQGALNSGRSELEIPPCVARQLRHLYRPLFGFLGSLTDPDSQLFGSTFSLSLWQDEGENIRQRANEG